MTEYPSLNGYEPDGILRRHPLFGSVEALIPTPYGSNHAPGLLCMEDGTVLAAWFAGTREGNADISIVVSRLESGAKQWFEPLTIPGDPERSEQNPSLFRHTDDSIWLVYTAQVARDEKSKAFNLQYTAEIRRRISRDGGHTWGSAEVLFGEPGSFCRQEIQILKSGRFIVGNWMCLNDDTRNGSDIPIMRLSDDNGSTWRTVAIPDATGCVHPYILETEPGHLLAFFRSRGADNIYQSRSNDDGESWSAPEPTVLPNNNSGISAIRLSSGRIAIVYNSIRFGSTRHEAVWPYERCPMSVGISDDGGKTWPIRRHLDMGDGFFAEDNQTRNHRYEYPCIYQDKDGLIHLAYAYYSRACIKYLRFPEAFLDGISHT